MEVLDFLKEKITSQFRSVMDLLLISHQVVCFSHVQNNSMGVTP